MQRDEFCSAVPKSPNGATSPLRRHSGLNRCQFIVLNGEGDLRALINFPGDERTRLFYATTEVQK